MPPPAPVSPHTHATITLNSTGEVIWYLGHDGVVMYMVDILNAVASDHTSLDDIMHLLGSSARQYSLTSPMPEGI